MYVTIDIEGIIAGKRFERIASLEVNNSLRKLGTTAQLEIPTSARLVRAGEFITETETAKLFEVGDPVSIMAGYSGNLREEFKGYVRKIHPTTPMKLELEDEVFTLKRKNLQKSWRTTTLADVVAYILEGTGIKLVGEVPGIELTKFYLKNVNGTVALNKLRDKYKLTMYFREPGKLFIGLASDTDDVVVKYRIGRNVVSHSLEWMAEDDVQIRIKAILISRAGKQDEVEVGDPKGELRTLHFYDLATGESLRERANQELLQYKKDGYKGSLTAWLDPACKVGNTVDLVDETFDNDRDGRYLVEEVKTTIGDSGARRRVTLGLKLSA